MSRLIERSTASCAPVGSWSPVSLRRVNGKFNLLHYLPVQRNSAFRVDPELQMLPPRQHTNNVLNLYNNITIDTSRTFSRYFRCRGIRVDCTVPRVDMLHKCSE